MAQRNSMDEPQRSEVNHDEPIETQAFALSSEPIGQRDRGCKRRAASPEDYLEVARDGQDSRLGVSRQYPSRALRFAP